MRPCRTLPWLGASAPDTSESTEVLPAPLTPTMPTRSPGPSRQVACESSVRSPRTQVDVLDVDDVLAEPLGGELGELEPVARRRHVSMSALAASMRNFGLDVRAGGAAPQPRQLLLHEVLAPRLRGGGLARRSALASTNAA